MMTIHDLEDDFMPRMVPASWLRDWNGVPLAEGDRVVVYGQLDAIDAETGEVDLLVELPTGFTNLPIVTVPATAARRLQFQPGEHNFQSLLVLRRENIPHPTGGPGRWRKSITCFFTGIAAAVTSGISFLRNTICRR